MKASLLLFSCWIFLFTNANAQCPPPGFPEPGNDCANAPLYCQGIDGFCHTFRNENIGQNFRGCPNSVFNNDDWLAFIAGTTTIQIRITPSNCTHIDVNVGVQAGIYGNCPTNTIMDLQCECTDQTFVIGSNNFVVGERYYLVVDGCDGDICDYTIEVIEGSTVAPLPPPPGPITGDSVACGGTTLVYMTDLVAGVTGYNWTIDPPNAAFFFVSNNNRLDVTWRDNFHGTAKVCLQNENGCGANPQISCVNVQVTPTPHVALAANPGVICLGYSDSTQLDVHLFGAGPWGFTPTVNGIPQDPVVTSDNNYHMTVKQAGVWKIIGLYQTESLCPGDNSIPVNVTVDTVRVITRTFCPGESVLIGGEAYTEPGIVRYILPGPFSCNSVIDFNLVQLPQPERTETLVFCPGESVTVNGQTYTQPGEVQYTAPGPNCDTLVRYLLRYAVPAPSTVTLNCPQNINEAIASNESHKTIDYLLPAAATDCTCPELTPVLLSGLASGADFPVGLTKVCYRATDLCGQSADCCFDVQVTKQQDEQPCDVKTSGCVRYELLSITADQARNQTYRIRVYNQCTGRLTYTAVQLPAGVTALNPANGGVFTSEEGQQFDVRNPNASPFYSIRFTGRNGGMAPGASATLKYTLPAQSDPDYIHVVSRTEPQAFMEAYLNTFNCPVAQLKPRNETDAAHASGLRVYPNPTGGRLWVDFSGWEENSGQWRIYNSHGALMLQGHWDAAEPLAIDLPENLASGLYFVECIGESGRREVKRWGLVR